MVEKLFGQNKNPAFSYEHHYADVAACQAMSQGVATPEQQVRAYRWIIEKGCMTYDETFHPEGERLSNFMQGRRFVGLKLVLFANASLPRLKKKLDPNAPPSEHGDR